MLILSALFVFSGWARAQEPPKPIVLPPAGIEVVRVDVVVTDEDDRPQAGLTRQDFTVLEDGKPQPIVHFEAFTRRSAAARSPDASAAMPVTTEAPSPPPPRFVVLAVDDLHIEPGSLMRAQKSLTRFVEEDVGPDDRVALVTTSGSGLSQELTVDRKALRQAISRLSVRPSEDWVGVPHISEYQAELIRRGDPDALDAAVQEIKARDPTEHEEVKAQQKARAIFDESVHRARLTLDTLERLVRNMAPLPGRKVILLVSDGFLMGLSADGSLGFDVRRITDAGTRAGVVVYSLESRGLTASPPGGSASSAAPVMATTSGFILSMQRRSEEATRDAMQALAADTGGFLYHDANDLQRGLRQVLEDTETFYVLAYEPANTKRDGAFRKIEVRVSGRRSLRVRARTGYFASAPMLAAAPSVARTPAGRAPADKPAPVHKEAPIEELVRAYRSGSHERAVALAAAWSDERIASEVRTLLVDDAAREKGERREVRILPSLDVSGLDRRGPSENADERRSRRRAAAAILAERAVSRLNDGDLRPLAPALSAASVLLRDEPSGADGPSFARDFHLLAGLLLHWHVEIAAGHRLLAKALLDFPDDPELHTALGSMIETVASLRTYASPSGSSGSPTARGGGYRSEAGEQAGVLPGARLAEAEAHYQRALALDPGLDEARLRLAHVRLLTGRAEEALRDLERVAAVARQPRQRYLARLFAGAAREQRGDVVGAVAAYRDGLVGVPRAQTGLLALGRALDQLGDKSGAQQAFAGAIAAGRPFDPWWSYRFGQPERVDGLVERLQGLVQ